MQLRRLQINGFKTFAGKYDFEFKDGITAVVGPNGSGKSNLSDAVRWALGEQSIRMLRGSSISDVIFSGTSARKQAGVAEVTVTIDNRDRALPLEYDEVSVTRRVFRDGESQFLVNNVECRLKDITDLFAGTGLGKEAYAAIEQGKVDAIISTQPSERRGIFDEASGIMRYKNRKKDAERKLTEVNERTSRASDIVDELAVKEPLLEVQAEAASRYKDAVRALKETELLITCSDAREKTARMTRCIDNLTKKSEVRERTEYELSALEASYEESRLKAAQASLAYDDALMKSQAAVKAATKYELAIKDRDASIGRIRLHAERATEDKEKAETNLLRFTVQLEELKKKREIESAHLKETNQKAETIGTEISNTRTKIAGMDEGLEKFRTEHFALLSKSANIRSAIGSGVQRMDANKQKIVRLQESAADKKKRMATCLAALDESERLGTKLVSEWELIQTEITSSRQILEAAKAAEAASRKSSATTAMELARIKATLTGLVDLETENEGYPQAVRAILEASSSNSIKGVLGTVGNLIKTEGKYIAAIEASLAGAVNNVVCATSEDAEACVEHLKKNMAGRATFLPVDIIRPTQVQPGRFIGMKGFVGVAKDLVYCDEAVKPAIEYALAGTVVFEDMKSALAAQKNGLRQRYATLEGEMLSAGGALTGGLRRGQGESVIARRHRIDMLKEQVIRFEFETGNAEREYAESQVIVKQAESKVKDLESHLLALRGMLDEAGSTKRRLDEESSGLKEQLSLIDYEMASIYEENAGLELDVQSLKTQLHAIESAIGEHDEKNLDDKQARTAQEAVLGELSERMTELMVRLATLEASLKSLDAEIRPVEDAIEENRRSIRRFNEEMNLLKQDEALQTRELTEERKMLDSYCEEADRWTAEHEKEKTSRDEAESDLTHLEAALKSTRKKLQLAREAENALNLEKARISGELDTLSKALEKEYGINIECVPEAASGEDRQMLSEKALHLKEEIVKLGDVNLAAADELSALKSRLSFMRGQLDDLDKARQSLAQVIKEAERTAKRQFLEVFEQIRGHFREIFSRLFEGGQADIVLVEPEEPLESGIEIICRPPGKKLSQLSLLSGGEKAMAAIALVFSFLKARPAPFCILDEIDAALDDANLDKFRSLVEDYSSDSQMILITHRRRTMEAAERVYGVTMEEQGVSKAVCVDASLMLFQEGIV